MSLTEPINGILSELRRMKSAVDEVSTVFEKATDLTLIAVKSSRRLRKLSFFEEDQSVVRVSVYTIYSDAVARQIEMVIRSGSLARSSRRRCCVSSDYSLVKLTLTDPGFDPMDFVRGLRCLLWLVPRVSKHVNLAELDPAMEAAATALLEAAGEEVSDGELEILAPELRLLRPVVRMRRERAEVVLGLPLRRYNPVLCIYVPVIRLRTAFMDSADPQNTALLRRELSQHPEILDEVLSLLNDFALPRARAARFVMERLSAVATRFLDHYTTLLRLRLLALGIEAGR